ncbi:uncharacterized protein [Vulpes vulpes]|uniref:CWF21 domain-containing protein n=2 Tax=Boreoeutheria TaxID=1437010 RepID=A0ABM4ZXZ7_VULVU
MAAASLAKPHTGPPARMTYNSHSALRRKTYYGSRQALRRARGCVLTRLVGRADVQRGPGGVRVAQSEPAAAPEEARRRRSRLKQAGGPARRGGNSRPRGTRELKQRQHLSPSEAAGGGGGGGGVLRATEMPPLRAYLCPFSCTSTSLFLERWCPPSPGHRAMYNGIGLPTPRGSGTNGYVQRNLSLVRGRRGERPDYKGEEELRRLEAALVKRPNPDILDHERKRRVELRCLELEEMMEEQGYEEQQIQEKVATFRLMLLEKDVNPGGKEETPGQRPAVTETHQLAELNEKKNERLRAAFGISDSYVDGSSFDPQRRAREAKQPAPEPPKPYSLVRESSSSRSPTPKQKKKKKKKDRGRSESSSPRRERKKSSKKKKHRSESESKKRKHRSPTPKSKRKSKDKKRKRSRSTTPAPKSRRAHRSTSADSASSSDTSRSRRCTDHSEDTVPAL